MKNKTKDDKAEKDDTSKKPEKKVPEKGVPEKPKSSMKNFIRILSYGSRGDYCLLATAILAGIGSGVAMPIVLVVFGQLVGDFANYFVPGTTVTRDQFQSGVNQKALYIVYIFIGKFCCSYIAMICARLGGLRISSALRYAYLRALLEQPISTIDDISPGKVALRITTSANTIQLAISQHFALLFDSVAYVVALYVSAFIQNWTLTLLASAALFFILVAYFIVVPFFMKNTKKTMELNETASALAYEILSSIRIVAAFGAQKYLGDQYNNIVMEGRRSELRNAPLTGFMMAPMFFSIYASFSLVLWYGTRLVYQGKVDLDNIVIVLFSVILAVGMVGRVASPIMSISRASTAATEIFTTIDARLPEKGGAKGADVPADGSIVFKDVSFGYPTRPDIQVLDNLNVEFEAGKLTAIVGPSGSGKSTLVGLLERWYDISDEALQPTEDSTTKDDNTAEKTAKKQCKIGGSITIGNVRLNDIDAKWWRSQIGLVSQEPFLFNDTIYNNVAFGLSGTKWKDIPEEEKKIMVQKACEEAYAHDFIKNFPQGYDTVVGEGGLKMSGGQRQRIAIARSIIKQPPILILDEATSAIDVRTERIVQQALDRVSKDRTTIVIAHRLSTIKLADKIVVLRQGVVVEEGSHSELLEKVDGVYHSLVTAQTLSVGDEAEVQDLDKAFGLAETAQQDANPSGDVSVEVAKPEVTQLTSTSTYKPVGIVRGFGKLLYEQRSHWIAYTLTIFGACGAGAVYPLQAYLFAKFVEVFTLTGSALLDRGKFWALMFFILALGVGISYVVLGWSSYRISVNVSTHYRQEYLASMLRKRIQFFDSEGNSSGTLTSHLSTDPTQLHQLMGMELSMALVSLVNLTGCIIISFVFGWKFSLIGTFVILPVILTAGFFRVKLEVSFEKLTAEVFADSSQFATEAVGAFRTVTSLLLEDRILSRYEKLLNHHVSAAFVKARVSTLVFALSDSVEMLCMALCFWFGGRLLASREYDLVQYFVIYTAIVQGSQAAGMWFSFAPNIVQARAAANRILSLRPTDEDQSSGTDRMKKTNGPFGVEFKDVSFDYAGRGVSVLQQLNLQIKPGQFAALVGASGCGKSTIISLLEKFYDPGSGTILCGDQDLTALDTKDYRSTASIVTQESTLYEGTVKDNLILSVSSTSEAATDEALHQACKDAQIHDFVMSLPEGYATKIGPKGITLSGGQRQRLALARAFLRSPRLLLLDEATSSLDSTSEAEVQKAIERAAEQGGRTIIAVAHRLATIQKADVIFVIGSGKVLEQGDHQSLLNSRGIYYQMCQAQALDR